MAGPKPGIALILAKKMRESAPKKAEAEAPTGELAAAEEAMAAIRAGDAEGFAAALKSFVRMCEGEDYETPEE